MGFFNRDKEALVATFATTDKPVSDVMLWICEKCGSKLGGRDDDNPTRRLQKAMKGVLGENKAKHTMRAMVTTCMNVCPEGKIAAAIVDLKKGHTRFVEFELKSDIEGLAQELYRSLRAGE